MSRSTPNGDSKQKEDEHECRPADKPASDSPQKKVKGNGKKRTRKHKRSATKDTDSEKASQSGTMDEPEEGLHKPEEGLHKPMATGISAVQLAEGLDDTVSGDQISVEGEGQETLTETDPRQRRRSLQLARAEERRREIERKRSEKRELEQLRQEEEARKQELLEKLAKEAKGSPEEEAGEGETKNNEAVLIQEEDHQIADLEAQRQKDKNMLLLEYKGQLVERELSTAEHEAQEAIAKARQMRLRLRAEEEKKRRQQQEMEQERQRRLKEEEEQRAQNQKEEEEEQKRKTVEKARFQAVEEAGRKLKAKEEMNYKMRLELLTQRHYQQMSTHLFSYFRYVPPATGTAKNKRKKTAFRAKKK